MMAFDGNRLATADGAAPRDLLVACLGTVTIGAGPIALPTSIENGTDIQDSETRVAS
jgi:hypothetical protein